MKSVFGVAAVCAVLLSGHAMASDRGPVTNLPMPRFVSLKASEGNVRRGPSLTHRIDWVFQRRNMPLQIIAEHGHWRRVQDRDGAGGWVHYTLLSGVRTVLVEEDMAPIHKVADQSSPVQAYAEAGVIARLGKCVDSWCRVTVEGSKGWIKRNAFWGLMAGETRD